MTPRRRLVAIPPGLWRRPLHLLAFGLGAGTWRYGPGTAGTLAAVPLYLVLAPLPAAAYVAVVVGLFGVGIWLCGTTARELGVPDHPGIVWDEWVGFLVTMAFAPVGLVWLAAGFVLFRICDIAKPWPIRWVDRHLGGGIGIMADDVLAGIYAGLVLLVARHIAGI